MPKGKKTQSGRKGDRVKLGPIALRLDEALAALDMTAAEVSEETGIPDTALSMYLNDKRRISLNHALMLKAAYGLSLDWLYCGDHLKRPFDLEAAPRRSESKPKLASGA